MRTLLITTVCFFVSIITVFGQTAPVIIPSSIEICVDGSITFDIDNPAPNPNSVMPSGSYQWTFAQARTISSNVGINNTAEWGIPGTHTVTVNEFDPSGNVIATSSIDVDVLGSPGGPGAISADINRGDCSEPIEPRDPIIKNGSDIPLPPSFSCELNACVGEVVTYTVPNLNGLTLVKQDWQFFSVSPTPSYMVSQTDPNSIIVSWTDPGKYYIVVSGVDANGCKSDYSIVVVCIEEAPIASFIAPGIGTSICLNEAPALGVFFDNTSQNATSYYWKITHTPVSGPTVDVLTSNNENLPRYNFSSAGDYVISLTATNDCGCSSIATMDLNVTEYPGPVIICPSLTCANTSATYSTLSECTDYIWDVVGGTYTYAGVSPAPLESAIEVEWDANVAGGYGLITLTGVGCVNGECSQPTTVAVPVVSPMASISGNSTVCAQDVSTYSVPSWPLTTYYWQISAAVGVIPLPGTGSSISIDWSDPIFANNPGPYDLSVDYTNAFLDDCDGDATITINVADAFEILTSTARFCATDVPGATISINNPGVTAPISDDFLWTMTDANGDFVTYDGNELNNFLVPGTQKLDLNWFANATVTTLGGATSIPYGVITLQITPANSNYCNGVNMVQFEVVAPPPSPGAIVGEQNVCIGETYPYSSTPVLGTNLEWRAANGLGNISFSPDNFSYTDATFNALDDIEVVSVTADFLRCESEPQTLAISNASQPLDQIDGDRNPCASSISPYELTFPSSTFLPNSISWSISDPSIASIVHGQGTTLIDLSFNNIPLGATTTIVLTATYDFCGTQVTEDLTLDIEPAIQPTITSDAIVCVNNATTFIPNIPPSIDNSPTVIYNWDFGDNTLNSTSNTKTPIYTYTSIGTYIVTLTIEDPSGGCIVLGTTKEIVVNPTPIADLSPNTMTVCLSPISGFTDILAVQEANSGWEIEWSHSAGNGNLPSGFDAPSTTNWTLNANDVVLGTYSITVSDANGCSATDQMTVVENCDSVDPLCNFPPMQVTADVVCNEVTFTVTIDPSATTLPTDIIWNFGDGTTLSEPAQGLTHVTTKPDIAQSLLPYPGVGLYPVSVSVVYPDGAYCPIDGLDEAVSDRVDVIINYAPDFAFTEECYPVLNSNLTRVLFEDRTEFLNVPAPIYWEWTIDDGANPPIFNYLENPGIALAGGTYTITLTVSDHLDPNDPNAQTCSITREIDIRYRAYGPFDWEPTCEPRTIAFEAPAVPSGVTLLSEEWAFGDGTSSLASNPVHGYPNVSNPVMVTYTTIDNFGCETRYTDLNVNVPNQPFDATITSDQVPGECYETSVELTANGVGGAPPYTYVWDNGSTNQTRTVTEDNTYSVTITDDKGCTASNNIPIALSQEPTLEILAPDEICLSSTQPSVYVETEISGAYSTIEWEVTYNNYDVANPPYPTISAPNQRAMTIFLRPTAFGGAVPISGSSITINIIVTGPSGCTYGPYTHNIDFLNDPVIDGLKITSGGCEGEPTTIVLEVDQSVIPDISNINWSNGVSDEYFINVTSGSNYGVTVTDNNGCKASLEIPLNMSADLSEMLSGCYELECDEDLLITAPGGYFDSWAWYRDNQVIAQSQGPSFADDLLITSAGTYSLEVTIDGCESKSQELIILKETCCEPAELTVECSQTTPGVFGFTVNIEDLNLNVNITDIINISPSGGNNIVATAEPLNDRIVGTFAYDGSSTNFCITFTTVEDDGSGGTIECNYDLCEPITCDNCPIDFDIAITDPSTCNDPLATMTVTNLTGGAAPFSYQWYREIGLLGSTFWQPFFFQTGPTLIKGPGKYKVRVIDALGCYHEETVTIDQPDCPCTYPADLTIACEVGVDNSYEYTLVIDGVDGTATGVTIDLTSSTGTITTENVTYNGGTDQTTITGTTLVPLGSNVCFSYEVTEVINGVTYFCHSAEYCEAITQCICPLGITVDLDPATCEDVNGGVLTATVTGGVPPFTYEWCQTFGGTPPIGYCHPATSDNTFDLNGFSGSVTVTVADATGCTDFVSITVDPLPLITATPAATDETCSDADDGTVVITVEGGSGNYNVSIPTPMTLGGPIAPTTVPSEITFIGLIPGNYQANIYDNVTGCWDVINFTVNEAPEIIIDIEVIHPTGCCEENLCNGSITYSVTGGTPLLAWQWSPTPAPNPNVCPGTYTLNAIDGNGCTASAIAVVNEPVPIVINLVSISNVGCDDPNSGSIDIEVTGGSGNYTYVWQPIGVTTQDLTNLGPGTYVVTVTDADNPLCKTTASYTITQETGPTVVGTVVDETCLGSDGSISLVVSGGSGNYTYEWSDPSISGPNPTGLQAGTYAVTVTDVENCSCPWVGQFTVNSSGTLTVTAVGTPTSCGLLNGTLTGTATGGSGNYDFKWSPAFRGQGPVLTNVPSGTYTLTVTDLTTGCTGTATATIAPSDGLSLIIDATKESCWPGNDATILITPQNGVGPYTYNWSTAGAGGGNPITGLSSGLHFVTVTDQGTGCFSIRLINIEKQPNPSVTLTVVDENCDAGDGSISATATGGTGPYTYEWSAPLTQTGATVDGLSAGTYTVTVTDIYGCTITATETVDGTTIDVVTSAADILCYGDETGTATATPSGGATPYSFLWSDGQETATATDLAVGTYSVTATDANGCTGTGAATVNGPDELLLSTTSTDSDCDANNGTVTLTVTGGTPTYSFAWSNSATTKDLTGVAAGTYTVTVTDANGCTATITETVENTVITAIVTPVDALCAGSEDGSATAVPSGGTDPYTYSWSNGGSTATINDLAAGTYIVTVTDANGCSTTASGTVEAPNPIHIHGDPSDPNCYGNNGTIQTDESGGTGPFTHLWSTGFDEDDIDDLVAGTYTLTVTDANGCTASESWTLVYNVISANTTSTDVSCFGGSDGTATATGNDGDAPYTFVWSDAQTTATATNLSAGTYTVTVTDNEGCSTTATATVSEPSELTASATFTNATCGTEDGTATASANGGTLTYGFLWSDPAGQTTATAVGLAPGSYTVTVTDQNGCTATASTTVGEDGSTVVAVATKTDVLCFGDDNGTASVTASGGSGVYTYVWTPGGAATSSISGLSPGTYSVVVTDDNGCTATSNSVTISEPSLLAVVATKTDATCGTNNGTATATPSGGSTPYTYLWSDDADQTTATATGLFAGTYTVTATDANGCTATDDVTINGASSITITPAVTHATCVASDGAIDIIVTGGTGPFTFEWGPNSETTEDLTNIPAGTYTVTVTDNSGCTEDLTIVVNATDPGIVVTANTTMDVSCFGGYDGKASVSASGGTAPYTYTWSGGAAPAPGDIVTGMAAGTYTVTATDANGCTETSSVTITQPGPLSLGGTPSPVTCNGGSDGSIDLTVTWGTLGYTYTWSPALGNIEDPTGLTAGYYNVTVVDANGCSATIGINVIEPDAISLATTTTNASCGGSDGSIDLTVTNGNAPYTYTWYPDQGNIEDPTGLSAGTYNVTVTDVNGCTASTSATVGEDGSTVTATASGTNITCFGAADGTATVVPGGGTPPHTYLWSPGSATTSSISGLTAGTYNVTVTDDQGCTDVDAVTITEPALLEAEASSTDVSDCYGDNTGTANVIASGGTTPYSYAWSHDVAATSASLSGLLAGTYTVTVTDNNGCTVSDVTTITEPTEISIVVDAFGPPICSNDAGFIDVSVTGGTPSYTYLWSTGATTQDISTLIAGTYTVTVTDANGCTKSLQYILNAASSDLSVTASSTDVICFGGSDGTATAAPSLGTGPYTFEWSDPLSQTSMTATGLSAGNYTVTTTDANGCNASSQVTVIEPSQIGISEAVTDATCTASNGAINLTISGSTGPYTFAWAPNGETTEAISALVAGDYTVTVTDDNGCVESKNITVGASDPSIVVVAVVDDQASCFGGNDGAASVSASGGTSPYTYVWSTTPTRTTTAITGLYAGTYTVTVTDANGCTGTHSATVTQPGPLALGGTWTAPLCNGGSDGSIDLLTLYGTPPYNYLWSNGSTDEDLVNVVAGAYAVTVTDANGCVNTFTQTISEPDAISHAAVVTDATCDAADGSIDLSINGGSTPFTYNWSPPQGGVEDPSGLTAGVYDVTVTDDNNCIYSTSVTVNALSSDLAASISSSNNITCFGTEDGSAIVIATGGAGSPYTYEWSDLQTTAEATGLTADHYDVTVTDANGCTASAGVDVTQPDELLVTIDNTTDTDCNDENGAIYVSVAGGTGPYTYFWSTTETTEDISGLSSGNYNLTVTDANGCEAMASAYVSTGAISLLLSPEPQLCGNTTGKITAFVATGTMPYTYAWSPTGAGGQVTGDVFIAPAGTYSVTVTDNSGCTVSGTETILDQTIGLSVTMNTTGELCFADPAGTATAIVAGGTEPYTYVWSNGGSQASLAGLNGGTYEVTVTDVNGCIGTASGYIDKVQEIYLFTVPSAPSCADPNSGSIDLSVSGGVPPYTYLWSDASTNEDLANVVAGYYEVTVTDANGCTISTSENVFDAVSITGLNYNEVSPACGATDGSVDLTVDGGIGPFTYLWSSGATSQDISDVVAGTYSVTVTAANGCTATIDILLESNPGLTYQIDIVDATCGSSDGSITLSMLSGVGPHTFLWSNGARTASNLGLADGMYFATITSADGCYNTLAAGVASNELEFTETHQDASCMMADGSITISVTSGVGPYDFIWSDDPMQINNTRYNLNAGLYKFTVTDATTGCMAVSGVYIDQTLSGAISYTTTNASCVGNDGTIDITPTGGTSPYSFVWSNGSSAEDQFGLAEGTFTVTMTDANGCTATESIWIERDQPGIAIQMTTTSSDCGTGNGSVSATVSGGVAPYFYAWADIDQNPVGGSTASLSGLSSGLYFVTVTDARGCGTVGIANLESNDISISTTIDVAPSCAGGNDGEITATITGSTGPYIVIWPTVNQSETNVAANTPVTGTGFNVGLHTIAVIDGSGCIAIAIIDVNSNSDLDVTATVTHAGCNNLHGSVDLDITGGIAPYSVTWSDANTDEDRANVLPGSYSVTVTDDAGCEFIVREVAIYKYYPMSLTYTTTPADCGMSNGSIDLTVTGGQSNYTYSWTPLMGGTSYTTEDISGVHAGPYQVIVSDASGCSRMEIILVDEVNAISADVTVVDESCPNADGSVSVVMTPADNGSNYNYLWLNGGSGSSNSGLSAGVHAVFVTDIASGCTEYVIAQVGSGVVPGYTVSHIQCGNNGFIYPANDPGFSYWIDDVGFGGPFEITQAGTYTLWGEDANGCLGSTDVVVSDLGTSTIVPQFTATTLTATDPAPPITFTNTSTGGSGPFAYEWFIDGQSEATSTNFTHTFTVPGTYEVELVVNDGACRESYIELVVIASSSARMAPPSEENDSEASTLIKERLEPLADIYPNPTSGELLLKLLKATNDKEIVKVDVSDLLGRHVYQQSFFMTQGNMILLDALNGLNAGIYLFNVDVSGNEFIKKIVLVRD